MSPAFTLEMDSRMDTGKWLERLKEGRFFDFLDDCGQAGVAALAAATPVRSGYTASSWSYEIKRSRNRVSLVWNNSTWSRVSRSQSYCNTGMAPGPVAMSRAWII